MNIFSFFYELNLTLHSLLIFYIDHYQNNYVMKLRISGFETGAGILFLFQSLLFLWLKLVINVKRVKAIQCLSFNQKRKTQVIQKFLFDYFLVLMMNHNLHTTIQLKPKTTTPDPPQIDRAVSPPPSSAENFAPSSNSGSATTSAAASCTAGTSCDYPPARRPRRHDDHARCSPATCQYTPCGTRGSSSAAPGPRPPSPTGSDTPRRCPNDDSCSPVVSSPPRTSYVSGCL